MSLQSDLLEKFEQARFDALIAIGNGDYATALNKWEQIKSYIDSTPDQERDGDALRWRSSAMEQIQYLNRKLAQSAGIQTQRIEYRRPGPPSCA